MKKKFLGTLYFFIAAWLIFSLSGCNGNSGKVGVNTAEIKEVAVLTSPALEVYRDYRIITDAVINNMDGAQYYVAGDIGDEASQATLNLGFSEEFDVASSFAVVNVSTGRVVFAYNPGGVLNTWKTGGNISITGGRLLNYHGLDIDRDPEVAASAVEIDTSNAIAIRLNSTSARINSSAVPVYDYVWHAEPDSISEYYTDGLDGEKISQPNISDGVYIARDIKYLTDKAEFSSRQTATKDGETEYAAYYSDSVANEAKSDYGDKFAGPYIFATLPRMQGTSLTSIKSLMTHSAEDAYQNPVLHIATPGIYSLSGTWTGQISVEADAVIILNGVTIRCSVAPAVVFKADAQEYGGKDESAIASSYRSLGLSLLSELEDKKANLVIIADGTTNNITGANVYRILKAEPKSSATKIDGKDISDQKKLYKLDGAFYSYVSLAICGESNGTGVLNITSSTFEGLDSELHMTIDGGKINITAPDDGINVNEDNISVFTQLGGTLTIKSTGGDGIDSNGYVVIRGGNLDITAGTSRANSAGEAGIDAEKSYYVASEANYTWTAASSGPGNMGIVSGDSWTEIQQQNLNETFNPTPSKEEYYKYYDANILSAAKQTDKGMTAINIGSGSDLSFIQRDTDPKARNINPTGYTFRLDRKINTFSGITH